MEGLGAFVSFCVTIMIELLCCIAVVLALFGFIGAKVHDINLDYEYEAEALIKECQAELPRNEHCVLKAVPQKEGE